MWLLKLSWKNLWRNKHRSSITMAAVFFAVLLTTLVSSLQKGVFENLIRNVVSFYTGYVQVHRSGYWEEQVLEKSFEQSQELERVIFRNKEVIGVTPRLESFALASSEQITRGCLVVGIRPQQEDSVTALRSKVVQGAYLFEQEEAVLIAQGLARHLKLGVHDTLVLIGQGYQGTTAAGKYPIRGVVRFGSPELNDKAVFLPLTAAQQLYGAERLITSYVLSIREPDKLATIDAAVQRSLGQDYEVMTWEELMPDVKQHIRTDTASMFIIIAILYGLICFGIFGTLLMMMVERRFELGMLIAIGMKKWKLCLLLLMESVSMMIVGCLLGLLASIPVVYYLHRHPIRFGGEIAKVYERFGFEAIFPTSTDTGIFLSQGLIVLVIGLVLSLYPVINIVRLSPVQAMRR